MKPRLVPNPLLQLRRALWACLAIGSTDLVPAREQPVNPAGFEVRRGINLSHWLSQYSGVVPRDVFITETDFKFIARIGYDHVRLPVDEKELWGEDGAPNEDAFGTLDNALRWARENGLRVVVDLHTVRAHHFNAANQGETNTLFTDPAAQQRFLDLWAELSRRLRDEPVDEVAYEIMNEPVADDPEDWNKLIDATYRQIRAAEPERVIVIGSNMWQMPSTFPDLKVPEDDKNIILSTHTYAPMVFTHHQASWTPLKIYEGPVQYPGRPIDARTKKELAEKIERRQGKMLDDSNEVWNADRMLTELQPAIDKARRLGLQLYCGEFGVYPTVPREDRLAYYSDLLNTLESNGVAWANWDYKGGFGIFERHAAQGTVAVPDVEFIGVLTGGLPKSEEFEPRR